MTREPNKLFNLLLPFGQYEALRILGTQRNEPIAAIIRRGISHILKSTKCKQEEGAINGQKNSK